MKRALLIACFAVSLIGCGQSSVSPDIVHIHGNTMGTSYQVSWVGGNEVSASVKAAVDERLRLINRTMSTYDSQSELSLINDSKQTLFPVSDDLSQVLNISLDVFAKTDGLFDVTVGPLVNLWGFGPGSVRIRAPDVVEVEKQLEKVGSSALIINGGELLRREYRYIDLSAVAKGWAVDEISTLMESRGYSNYLVEIGGEIKLSGQKAPGYPWKIAIERPDTDVTQRKPQLIISPGDRAVATSGDYRNYFEENGVRYSHTINPRTGRPIEHKLASVTVVHPSSAYADAWATALSVAGEENAMVLAERNQLAAYLIVRSGDGFTEKYSSKFKEWFH